MTAKYYYGLTGYTTANVDSSTLTLPVDSTITGALTASGFTVGDETWFSLSGSGLTEVVKVTSAGVDSIGVTRAQLGTTAQAWPSGTPVEFVVTAASILDDIGDISTAVTITGNGLAVVTNPEVNEWQVSVASPTFTGLGGISVLGTWPNIQIVMSLPDDDCCGTGGGGSGTSGITSLVGDGIVTAYASGGTGFVSVTSPTFTAGSGITITGSWPTYTIAASGGGGGTVTSVSVGAGLTLTGSPTVNPTISITNTGVTAGTYGDVVVNGAGQFTSINPAFNPVSSILTGTGLGVSRTGSAVTLTPVTAAVGTAGIVPLADETEPLDPDDDDSAVTPALLAAVLDTLGAVTVLGGTTYTGEIDADYVDEISSSTVAINLAAGEKAILFATVTAKDGTTPSTPVEYGIGVFDLSSVSVVKNNIIPQCTQTISTVLTGPIITSYKIITTDIPATASVIGSGLWIIQL